MMTPHITQRPGGTMRTRTLFAAVVVALLALSGCSKSDEEKEADCQKAIDATSTVTNRPDACKDIPEQDYKGMLLAYTVGQVMPSPS